MPRVLFDMDGVLVDSTPAVARVWTGWALEHGLVPDEVVRRAHGRPSIATIIELLPHGDHDAENREVERREIEDIADVVALPGALELLQSIPQARWTIVTSASRRAGGGTPACGWIAGAGTTGHCERSSARQALPRSVSKRSGGSAESRRRIALLLKTRHREFAQAKQQAHV